MNPKAPIAKVDPEETKSVVSEAETAVSEEEKKVEESKKAEESKKQL